MFHQLLSVALLYLLLDSTTAAPKPKPAPACSWDTPNVKCTCPANTFYSSSTTWATIGANARDVRAITDNCRFYLRRRLREMDG